MKEVALYTGKKLGEILEGCSLEQRRYLSLRVRGLERIPALKVCPVDVSNETFQGKEEYLVSHRSEYEDEAITEWSKTLTAKAQVLQEWLIDKGLAEWDRTDRTTKIAISGLLKILGAKDVSHKDEGPGSYDELVLRRRRVLDQS